MSNTSQQPRLLSFTLDNWSVLGRRVSVSLVDRVGVLVGLNGAGKSAIIEGFEAISSCAIGMLPRSRLSGHYMTPGIILETEILTPTGRILRYQYKLISLPTATYGSDTDSSETDDSEDYEIDYSTSDDSENKQYSFEEYCEYVDEDKKWLWKTETGVTTINNDNDTPYAAIFGNTDSLRRVRMQSNSRLGIPIPVEMEWVHSVLKGVHFLAKVPPRQTIWRSESFIKVSSKGMSSASSTYGLAEILTRKILRRILAGELEEFESLCRRIGLGNRISIQKFILDEGEDKDKGYVSSVLLDGVNIGLLSDGTLRVLSILIDIVALNPNSTTIIEEPEKQIHPGMLAKLLNEIQSYTYDGNLILSTHSLQVVGWTTPNTINLVYRNEGGTIIRKLTGDEIQKVNSYLYEEGDLGEWLYSGVMDE